MKYSLASMYFQNISVTNRMLGERKKAKVEDINDTCMQVMCTLVVFIASVIFIALLQREQGICTQAETQGPM